MSIESRARDILGLQQLEGQPRHLSMRIENLWRAEGFAPVVPFHGSIFVPMGKAVDTAILKTSIAAVAARHDVLHSRLAIQDRRPVQLVDEIQLPDLEIVDVSRAEIAAHREGGAASALSAFVDAPINLLTEPGFRYRAFRDEDGNITLGVMLHHYFGDGWSSQVVRREVSTAYALLSQNSSLPAELAAQYADYALAQRQALAKDLPAHLAYWQKRLEGAPPSRLPYDHVRDTNMVGRSYFGIGEELPARLAASFKVSPFALYLGALQILLARWSGENRIVTAVNTADRINPRFENTVGYLISSVPVDSVIDDEKTVGDFLAGVGNSFYQAYAHRDLSYDLYDAICNPPQPFATTLFNFIPLQDKLSAARAHAAPVQAGLWPGPDVQRVRVHREIYFCLIEQPRGMVGKIYYNLDFFAPATIAALIARFTGILEKMAAGPATRLADIH